MKMWCIAITVSLIWTSLALGAEKDLGRENRLLIRASGQKIYMAIIKSDLSFRIVDLFPGLQANEVSVNQRGAAWFLLKTQEHTATLFIERMNALSGPALQGSTLPDSASPPAAADISHAALSPDGKLLCGLSGGRIVVIELDRGVVETVYGQRNVSLSPPAWAPDSSSVAFYCADHNVGSNDNFSVMIATRTNGTWRERVVAPPSLEIGRTGKFRPRAPCWAPAGDRLVFVAHYGTDEKGPQTYSVCTNGESLLRISGDAGDVYTPHPLIDAVTYAQVDQGGCYIYNFAGKKETKICDAPLVFPKLSSDGKLIAMCDADGNVYVIRVDDQKQVLLIPHAFAVNEPRYYWIKP
jgi:hypothetical protein